MEKLNSRTFKTFGDLCEPWTGYVINLKYTFRHFHVLVSMKPFRIIMNEAKPESTSTLLYPYSLQSYWTSKFGKIIPYAIFAHKRALPCVTKIIWTQKLFGVGSSNVGYYICSYYMDNWATHYKKNWTRSEDEVRGDFWKSAHLTWNDPLVFILPEDSGP